MKKILFSLGLGILIVGCSSQESSNENNVDKHDQNSASYAFGELDKGNIMPIEEGIMQLEDSQDTAITITTKSTVSAVCEMMGCWMSIPANNNQEVRITFENVKQVVPKDIVGDSVFISGTLQQKNLSVDMRRHLLMDKGFSEEEAAALVSTDTVEYALIANAVEILHK